MDPQVLADWAECDKTDTLFVVICSVICWGIIPAVGLGYSGYSTRHNSLASFFPALLAVICVSLQWYILGYSLAYGEGNGFIGDLKYVFHQGVLAQPVGTIPAILFSEFQLVFAATVAAIAIGGACERGRLLPLVPFLFLWTTFVYCPLAHMVWSESGFLNQMGVLDFAGGTPVHICSGATATAISVYLSHPLFRSRKSNARTPSHLKLHKPHNTISQLLSLVTIWGSWLAFDAGTTLSFNFKSVHALCVTNVCAAAGALTWNIITYYETGKFSLDSTFLGAISGLVMITPAAGFISMTTSLFFGIVGALVCRQALRIKFTALARRLRWVDNGTIATGLFANKEVAAFDGTTEIVGGVFVDGNFPQIFVQILEAIIGFTSAFGASYLIFAGLDCIPGLEVLAIDETSVTEERERDRIGSSRRQQQDVADNGPNESFDGLPIECLPASSLHLRKTTTSTLSNVDMNFLLRESALDGLAEDSIELTRGWNMPTTGDFVENSSEYFYNELNLEQMGDSDNAFNCMELHDSFRHIGTSHESTEWSSLVSRYFQMIEHPPLLPSLENKTTTLVQYYFHDTCATWSSFDSEKNPFRTAIEVLWQKSPLIYYAIQSNAAAHLSNQFSSMQITASNMREKAHAAFLQELRSATNTHSTGDELLLATLLLGVSASWHDSDDLVYWEMVAAFVSGEGFKSPPITTPDPSHFPWAEPLATTVIPHPWTGIAPRVMLLFGEVGRLVQDYATSAGKPRTDLNLVALATKLEEDLLSVCIPTEDKIADVYDELTSKNDFIVFAEATRCAALLQIYRVFPDVLHWRLGAGTFKIMPLLDVAELNSGKNMSGSWLIGLAMHVLNLLASVPAYSGVRCVQLLPLATAAFELRASPGTSYSDVEIAKFRDFVMGRLELLAGRLPSKPISRITQLLNEVWRRNDRGDDTFWLNVMVDKNWKTFLG
ncbi:uncharacterized protein N7484_007796 [Penicillium longicatenatum]|uniref:uncharacterized protein n=1 Tax=Penicillium longicatenatum TaxID=1561947 RepID=UPI002547A807|nr:uncharacterized protein N7484_007796 [Penicillium longicatenatum]KAJ5639934.1 hypothetical protein N7484_007796 [Penicillium longicatenatum]